MNTFGTRLKMTSFGESHGKAIGVVIDGMPSNVKFDEEFLQKELDKERVEVNLPRLEKKAMKRKF